jgi:chaperonin GroEL (HSP60 family)
MQAERLASKVIAERHGSPAPSYFVFMDECKSPKACTILLRGPSKDILNEIDRNLADAMGVARNVVFNPMLAPGGGATEMAISVNLAKKAKAMQGVEGAPYKAIADALEVIPRTLVQNCGGNAIRTLTELRVRWLRPLSTRSYQHELTRPTIAINRPNTQMGSTSTV